MGKGLLFQNKKEGQQKRMQNIACCLGKQQQKDVLDDHSKELHKHDQQPQVERADSIVSTQPQLQSTTSVMSEQENPEKPRAQFIKEILEHLKKELVCEVVLHGKNGVGKTWIAKEVTKQVVRRHIADVTIWVYLNKKNLDPVALYRNIAHQLSSQLDLAGAEYHLEDEDKRSSSFLIESLKHNLKGRKCLLVLDDRSSELNEDNIVTSMLDKIFDSHNRELYKVLITTCRLRITENQTKARNITVPVEITQLTQIEAEDLLQRTWEDDHNIFPCNDLKEIVERCNNLPAAIVFTGNVLRSALEHEANGEKSKMVVIEAKRQGETYWMLGCYSGNEMFINNITMLKCLRFCRIYLEEYSSINYNVLILNWILEGCIENATSLKEAYSKLHKILLDLLDAGLLGEREAGDIVLERPGLNLADYIISVLCVEPGIEFSCIFENLDSRGNVKRMNGSLAAFQTSRRGRQRDVNLVTLLVEGNDLSKVHQNEIFAQSSVFERLQILCLSHIEPNTDVFLICRFLRVLILRDCNIVNYIDSIAALSQLRVLEISGCSFIEMIRKDFFAYFGHLESLNLSGNPIPYFPRPISDFSLINLRTLILRRCTQLESFSDVGGLDKLEVLDISGAKFKSLDKKDLSLPRLPKLKMLDISDTNIYESPALKELANLTHLLLKNCPLLNKLRPVTTLTKLQVIDASGSSDLRYIREVNLPRGECLRKLDLSSTMIRKVPPLKNVNSLVYLSLKGCSQLKELPTIEGAINLRFLDTSDAIQLDKINTSFHEMKSLQELFLSNTKIKTLPPISGLESLRRIVLRGCELLQSLPKMDGLVDLLLLDIWGCIALETLLDNEQLSHVTILKS